MQRALARCLSRLPNRPARLLNADRPRITSLSAEFYWTGYRASGYSTETNAKPPQRNFKKHMPKQHREIITLDAAKIPSSGQLAYDISGYSGARFKMTQLKPPQLFIAYYTIADCQHVPFPAGSTGVFYYHPPSPGAPVLTGELRFKLCTDLASFATSPDLQLSNETRPWSLNLYSILTAPKWIALRQMLVRDRLVSPVVVEAISNLPRVNIKKSRILYSLEQPFEFELGQKKISFVILGLRQAALFKIHHMCSGNETRDPSYTGRIRARFELSTQPEHSTKGPTLVLRVLELLGPLKCHIPGKMLEPRPGELLSRHGHGGSYAWSCPLEERDLVPVFGEFVGLPPVG
ncbi:hypothetical protein NLJ89_g9470 [Agrocybe chaxingu]|uniref:Uncharacterized protein n=1 Tax=Agrocybe chaxingu TaxID=84603 RepID=A0A9W8JTB7_9AGAR|nr:hypothetical protein NLJ89_g9470 [Agrocybe chaxingu]